MTLIYSRYQTQLKLKKENNRIEKQIKKSPFSPNLQSFIKDLLSGNGFIVLKS